MDKPSDVEDSSSNNNEEHRLREKVLQRRKARQMYEDKTMTESPSASKLSQQTHTVSSGTTDTATKQPPHGEGSLQGSLPVSSSQSRSTETHQLSPSRGLHHSHPHDDPTKNDQSTGGGGSKGQGDSLASSGSPPTQYNERSGKSRKRERRRQRRQMNRDSETSVLYGDDSRGEGASGFGSAPSREETSDRPQRYQDYPPHGRWERDRDGGSGGDRYSLGSGNSRERRGGPPPRLYYDDPRGGPPPRGDGRYDDRGRPPDWDRRRRSTSRSRSSHSRSHSQGRSRDEGRRDRSRENDLRDSQDRDRRTSDGSTRRKRSRGDYCDRDGGRYRKRHHSSRHRGDSYQSFPHYSDDMSSTSHSSSSSSSSSSSGDSLNDGRSSDKNKIRDEAQSAFSKDQRTVFVTQLVMRTTEKDIQRYFKKKVGCKVNEVILLRDRRTRSHKGCAYVQFGQIEDVAKAVGVSGQAPDFQRFPILVKASEAEKNYSIPASASVITASMMGTESTFAPFIDKDGRQVESQKVYIGGLDPSVSEEHLFAIFSQFGQLEKVSMQMDPASNASRGYAFLSFRDPKDANLAIQSMTGQVLAGRPMKTGWANQASSIPGVPIVTSDEFPLDSSARAQKALQVLGQLVGGPSEASINAQALSTTAEKAIEAAMGVRKIAAESAAVPTAPQNALSVPTVAQARESLQASLDAQSSASAVASALTPASNMMSLIGGADNPTRHILVHNMYNKDEETDPEWEKDIKEEFTEEASKFGKIQKVAVMHQEPGGKIYVSFEKADGARICAENLAGRWFDKRQLRVEFITDDDLPAFMKNS